MTDYIAINRSRLADVLDQMREAGRSEALTTEIIGEYMGGFHSNRGVPVTDSWNGQFGKYLKAHMRELRIDELETHVRVPVGDGITHTSRWGLNAG